MKSIEIRLVTAEKNDWDYKRKSLKYPVFKIGKGTTNKQYAKSNAMEAAKYEKIGDKYAKRQNPGTPRYNYGVACYKLAKKHLSIMKKYQIAHKKLTGENIDYSGIWHKAAYGNQHLTGFTK